jgi:hypothetical protein
VIKTHIPSSIFCCAFLAQLVFSEQLLGETIGINFNNGGATLLGANDFVGVVPSPNWNNFQNNGGLGLTNLTPTVLNSSGGVDSGARITWDVGASAFNSNNGQGNQRMMEGWFGMNVADNGFVTVDNLPSSLTGSGYNAYIYFDSNEIAPNERTMTFTVGGTSIAGKELDVNFPGAFTEASGGGVGNYVVFRGLTDSTFSLDADSDAGRASINGIQLTNELPPPPGAPVNAYVASQSFNTADMWFDTLGGRHWSLSNAELATVQSPHTTLDAAYRLTDVGPGFGGDTSPYPTGNITYELWVKTGDLDESHQVVFETGGGQNGTSVLVSENGVRLLNSASNARGFDMTVPWDEIDVSDYIQIVAALDPDDNEIDLYVNGSAGGSGVTSASGTVGRGGNRASLFTWGSGLVNIGDPTDGGGGTFNLGGRTELPDMTPAGLTQFNGDIALMNVYSRTFDATDVQMAFKSVAVPEPGTFGLFALGLLTLAIRRRR